MANGDFKHLTSRTASDKILHDKAFYIDTNRKYYGYGYYVDLLQWSISILIKKLLVKVLKIRIFQTNN